MVGEDEGSGLSRGHEEHLSVGVGHHRHDRDGCGHHGQAQDLALLLPPPLGPQVQRAGDGLHEIGTGLGLDDDDDVLVFVEGPHVLLQPVGGDEGLLAVLALEGTLVRVLVHVAGRGSSCGGTEPGIGCSGTP